MGCVHSRVDREETVQRCRERQRLMKQLLGCRAELVAAHMAYLQSLRNTGATLRQFTEVESIIPYDAPPGFTLPPSPPLPPPPLPFPISPPPPPHYSPDKKEDDLEEDVEESSIDIDDDESCTLPPPPIPGSTWNFWDPFGLPDSLNSSSSVSVKKDGGVAMQAALEEEDWAETNTEFEAEDGEEEMERGKEEANVSNANANVGSRMNLVLNPMRELMDDNSSAMSGFTKDTDTAVVVWRSKKTLAGIMKELDDYFLKAAAGGKDVAVLLESNRSHNLQGNFEKNKGN